MLHCVGEGELSSQPGRTARAYSFQGVDAESANWREKREGQGAAALDDVTHAATGGGLVAG